MTSYLVTHQSRDHCPPIRVRALLQPANQRPASADMRLTVSKECQIPSLVSTLVLFPAVTNTLRHIDDHIFMKN